MKSVRIGAGQGFWGDSPFPALDVVRSGNVKYLACDALAELTLAILQKARQKDPDKGYVEDLFFKLLLQPCRQKGVKILTNAGGINPHGAGRMVFELARSLGIKGLKIAVITGDDVLPKLAELREKGVDLSDMESGGDISTIKDRIVFANAYLGAKPMVEALEMGADVIITGRTSDPAQFLAPMVYELGWSWDDWDRLAAGILMGHLMECSAQSTGGNFSGDWWNIPDMERIGYPVAEVYENGDAVLTKPEGTGGRVDLRTVKEQMLYEVHDPTAYITPDVVADFTSPRLVVEGPDRVRITGMKGKPRPENLKVSIGYSDGWMGEGTLKYSWPNALKKARKAEEITRKQFAALGISFDEILFEYVGYNSLSGPLATGDGADLNEVGLRIAMRTSDKMTAARMPRLLPPLALNGPPTATGSGGMARPRELIGMWSALVPRDEVEKQVQISIREVG
ncbi:acyclic terpene utilization AtuA family protein [Desulfotruncus alcoholivorax]|uniref:acyclic terpene utilization AtuA family protein n=1 Tax=Desulfotruncus alcoholivorax TaxID=265477 RepID=UPI0004167645|nr:acyclic terpene utilization AtuA family protein [Desulfotruncus alcoholivorax]